MDVDIFPGAWCKCIRAKIDPVAKRDVIAYYHRIAPVLLPHLQGRALTVTRWPDGVEGKSFFQKQTPAHAPDWVQTVRIPQRGKPIDYTLVEDLPTLVWLANLAAIEVLQSIEASSRQASPGEQRVLARFSGFGDSTFEPGEPQSAMFCGFFCSFAQHTLDAGS